MAPTAAQRAWRQQQCQAHTFAAILLSVTARQHDLDGRPDLAQQASRDAAANCRCIWAIAGFTNQGATP